MSFLSVLKTIGHVLGGAATAATPLAPLIGAIPVAGPLAVTILGAITAVENLITSASSGPVKKSVVTAIVNANHPGVDPTSLAATIDKIVAALNALALALGPATE